MKQTFKILLFICLLLPLHSRLKAQQQGFRNYGEEQGLNQKYIYNISQNSQGYLCLSTSEGFVMYGGDEFTTYEAKDGLAENFTSTHLKTKSGTMLMGHFQKGLSTFNNENFTSLKSDSLSELRITDLKEVEDYTLIGTQGGGLWVLYKNKISQVKQLDAYMITHVLQLESNKVLISTSSGVIKGEIIKTKDAFSFKEKKRYLEDEQIIKCLKLSNNKICIGTKMGDLWVFQKNNEGIFDGKKIINATVFKDALLTDFIFKDSKKLWVSTLGSGIFKFSFLNEDQSQYKTENYTSKNGLPGDNIQCFYLDHEKNLWIGTFGNGLSILPSQKFTIFNKQSGLFDDHVSAIIPGAENDIWVGNLFGLNHVLLGRDFKSTQYDDKNKFVTDEVKSLYKDRNDNIWVGTATKGVYLFDYKKERFTNISVKYGFPKTSINHITGDNEDNIYVATDEGLYIINQKTNTFQALNTSQGSPHNVIEHINVLNNGDIWFASHGAAPFNYINEAFNVFKDIKGVKSYKFNSITKDKFGNIWYASEGDGVFKFNKNSNNFKHYSTQDGLISNFCRTIFSDENGHIWVGHRNGLSKKLVSSKKFIKVSTRESQKAIENNRNAFYIDENEDIWFGTTEGIVRYDHNEDFKNKTPPKTFIRGVSINNETFIKQNNVPIKLKSGTYALDFSFLGISFKDPSKVTYNYRLLGFDDKWIKVGNNSRNAYFPRLESGHYTFELIAFNNDGVPITSPEKIEIDIDIPIYLKWWFITIGIIIILLALGLIFYIRERNSKKVQEYLEKTLDKRTLALVRANDELEEVNNEVKQSINYAKRIQSAVMPDLSTLDDFAKQVYIYYKPRDVISGDFYWFTERKGVIIMIAADCTGHGVPGAMLSMIGATLFDKLVIERNLVSPLKIMEALDENFQLILGQFGLKDITVADGMDVGICMIDTKNKQIKYAGAGRPLYYINNNELTEFKSSPFSIGASMIKQKNFEETEFKYKKGDEVILSSDGYADQFGEESDKKFNRRRLRVLLSDIHKKDPTEKQFELNKAFMDWKGDVEQTDDVLVIGVNL